jgi:hypothetical protein
VDSLRWIPWFQHILHSKTWVEHSQLSSNPFSCGSCGMRWKKGAAF